MSIYIVKTRCDARLEQLWRVAARSKKQALKKAIMCDGDYVGDTVVDRGDRKVVEVLLVSRRDEL